MPLAPTNLTITEGSPGPIVTLAWEHGGATDRFELLYRRPGEAWRSFMLAPKSDFGTGPYSYTTGTAEDLEWAVRAVDADGTVSV